MKLGIFGAGGLGCQVFELACWQNEQQHCWEEIIFVDDVKPEGECYGTRNIHFDTLLNSIDPTEIEFVIALGEPTDKEKIFNKLKSYGFAFGKVIAPNARVSKSAILGDGVILQVGSLIGPGAEVGNCVTVEDYASVGHNSNVGDHCHICAKVNIGGGAQIGKCVFIGLHSATKQGISLGEYSVIGMGGIVLKDVEAQTIVAGVPAKKIKDRTMDMHVF